MKLSPDTQQNDAEEIFCSANMSYGDVKSGSIRPVREVDSPQDVIYDEV